MFAFLMVPNWPKISSRSAVVTPLSKFLMTSLHSVLGLSAKPSQLPVYLEKRRRRGEEVNSINKTLGSYHREIRFQYRVG